MTELSPAERDVILTALGYFHRHAVKQAHQPLAAMDFQAYADRALDLSIRLRQASALLIEDGEPQPKPQEVP